MNGLLQTNTLTQTIMSVHWLHRIDFMAGFRKQRCKDKGKLRKK